MKKTPGDIITLHKCTKNYDQMMHDSWDIVHDGQMDRWMDGWTDGQKKWDIEVGAPTKNWIKYGMELKKLILMKKLPKNTKHQQ